MTAVVREEVTEIIEIKIGVIEIIEERMVKTEEMKTTMAEMIRTMLGTSETNSSWQLAVYDRVKLVETF